MHFAVASKNVSLVKLLDEYNSDATIKNAEGLCPIDLAMT